MPFASFRFPIDLQERGYLNSFSNFCKIVYGCGHLVTLLGHVPDAPNPSFIEQMNVYLKNASDYNLRDNPEFNLFQFQRFNEALMPVVA